MSDLQPSPDLQVLFDRLEVAAGGSQVWYSKGRAKPIISEWAKQRDEELRRRIEVLEGMLATLGANYKNLQAVTPQRDEELAALREENERLGEQNQGLYAALLIIGKERDGLAAENERLRDESQHLLTEVRRVDQKYGPYTEFQTWRDRG